MHPVITVQCEVSIEDGTAEVAKTEDTGGQARRECWFSPSDSMIFPKISLGKDGGDISVLSQRHEIIGTSYSPDRPQRFPEDPSRGEEGR